MTLGVLPCQGTSNTGVMTTKAAMHVVNQENICMVCPLGLPLGIKRIIDSAKTNDYYIALNGCPMKCASKALDSVDIENYDEITLTSDFDIQKNNNFHDETGLSDVKEYLEKYIQKIKYNN